MFFKKKSASAATDIDSQAVTENLYKQNLELAVKNKTLSLLDTLHEVSIKALEPRELSLQMVKAIQADFSLELVAIYIFNDAAKHLGALRHSRGLLTESFSRRSGAHQSEGVQRELDGERACEVLSRISSDIEREGDRRRAHLSQPSLPRPRGL